MFEVCKVGLTIDDCVSKRSELRSFVWYDFSYSCATATC